MVTPLIAISAVVVVFGLPAIGAEEDEGGEGDPGLTSTTVAEETPTEPSGLVPAVEVVDEENIEAQSDWTYRYLVPTGLALAVIVVLFTSIRYFTNVVRERYRIVEE